MLESISLSDIGCRKYHTGLRKVSDYRILDRRKYDTIGNIGRKVSNYWILGAGKYQTIGYWMQESIRLSDAGCRKVSDFRILDAR
jgi:hypothetical protein